MKEIKYKVGDKVNYRSANGPILCRVTEHLPGYFERGSTDGWKIVKVDGSGWAGKSSNNCSDRWLTPVTLKTQRTLTRKRIHEAIFEAGRNGVDKGSRVISAVEASKRVDNIIEKLFDES